MSEIKFTETTNQKETLIDIVIQDFKKKSFINIKFLKYGLHMAVF